MDDALRDERRAQTRRHAVKLAREVEYARVNLEMAVKRYLGEPNDKAYKAALSGRWNDLQAARFAARQANVSRVLCVCGACWRVHTRASAAHESPVAERE